jgi:antibiotic biosynthesis monooxygenase (ABM) superfamily enzyme
MRKDKFLTPKETEIESIIDHHAFTSEESGKLLRVLSAMNEEYKSFAHWHTSPYIQYLIEKADNLINSFKNVHTF